jgi:hypothetical protein
MLPWTSGLRNSKLSVVCHPSTSSLCFNAVRRLDVCRWMTLVSLRGVSLTALVNFRKTEFAPAEQLASLNTRSHDNPKQEKVQVPHKCHYFLLWHALHPWCLGSLSVARPDQLAFCPLLLHFGFTSWREQRICCLAIKCQLKSEDQKTSNISVVSGVTIFECQITTCLCSFAHIVWRLDLEQSQVSLSTTNSCRDTRTHGYLSLYL